MMISSCNPLQFNKKKENGAYISLPKISLQQAAVMV